MERFCPYYDACAFWRPIKQCIRASTPDWYQKLLLDPNVSTRYHVITTTAFNPHLELPVLRSLTTKTSSVGPNFPNAFSSCRSVTLRFSRDSGGMFKRPQHSNKGERDRGHKQSSTYTRYVGSEKDHSSSKARIYSTARLNKCSHRFGTPLCSPAPRSK